LSAAGAAKHAFSGSLWIASLPCLVVALTGLCTALLIQPTPIAQPNLQFQWSSLAMAAETRQLLWRDRKLLGVLLMSSTFWFVGGTVYPSTINAFCKEQLKVDDAITGVMAASTGLGIAVGCVLAGLLSRNRVRGWLVRTGAWGLTLSLAVLCLPGPGFEAVRQEIRVTKAKVAEQKARRNSSTSAADARVVAPVDEVQPRPGFMELFHRGSLLGPLSVVALISVGFFAGFFSVPLQVYLQMSAPADQKGRIIGALNLLNWIGIAGAGGVYALGRYLLITRLELPHSMLFGFAAVLILPVALFYRPPETPA
jgi:acyl-[acyl-carrier-protein]-phospholipid O-acyltransferase/long-chain-fatty-acid--[acyl-carrier-protein] ligase